MSHLLTGWISSVPFLHQFGVSNCQPRMTQQDISLMLHPMLGLLWLVCHASRIWNWIFNTASFTRQGDGVWTTMKNLRCYNLQSSVSEMFPKQTYLPRLDRLGLFGFRGEETHLVSFLGRHARTLFVLQLGNARLISDACSGAQPCWVRVIRWLQTDLNLKEMRFATLLANGDSQSGKSQISGNIVDQTA
jgi:hypothetical protein